VTDWKPTLAVDLDGVVHAYRRGWEDGVLYDQAMPGTLDAFEDLSQRYRLVVFTARDPDTLPAVWDWLTKHGLEPYVADVTNAKPAAVAYIDDRAIHFESWEQAVRVLDERHPERVLG
jgi:FMN phosphatase YigB (HAD superfamily)